jgi:hypothetical protein
MSEPSCEEVRDALLAGTSSTDAALEAHAEHCEPCATLLLEQAALGRALGRVAPAPSDARETWPRVALALERESGPRAWLRSRSTRARITLALGLLVVVMLLGAVPLRADWPGLPLVVVSTWLGAFVATGLFVVALALPDLGRAGVQRAGRSVWPWVALALPAAYALTASYTLERLPLDPRGALLEQALSCFGYGLLLSSPLLALFWLLDRGAGPQRRVLAAAAATGLAANGALVLHCPASDEAHLLLGHATIGVTLALVAWLAVTRRNAP